MKKNTNEKLLDDLLNDMSADDSLMAQDNGLNIMDNIISPMDYDATKDKNVSKAKKTLLSLIKFYLENDALSENEYLKQKILIEEATLSGLIHQIELNERMSHTIMRMVDNGMITPDLFREFTNLQKVYIELAKTKTMHLINTEESVKKLKIDYDFYKSQESVTTVKKIVDEDIDKLMYRGTKQLLDEIDDEDNE